MTFDKTKKALNQLVADLSQASAAIHQIHWYMRGENFVSTHELMDTYRDTVEDQLDEVAERLITIDGAPYSTLEQFVENSAIKSIQGDYEKSIADHRRRLVEVFRALAKGYGAAIKAAQEDEDNVTEDMCIDAKGTIEQYIWMQQAELGEAPKIAE